MNLTPEPFVSHRLSELCAVCSIDPESGRRGTVRTNRLCATCKSDPANADWVEEHWETAPSEAGDVGADDKTKLGHLWSRQDQRLREVTQVQADIIRLFAVGVIVRVPHFDRDGRRRGFRPLRLFLSESDIGHLLGVNRKYVGRVLRSFVYGASSREPDEET